MQDSTNRCDIPYSADICPRLGAPGRIHPGNKERSSRVLTADIRDPQQLRKFYDDKGNTDMILLHFFLNFAMRETLLITPLYIRGVP